MSPVINVLLVVCAVFAQVSPGECAFGAGEQAKVGMLKRVLQLLTDDKRSLSSGVSSADKVTILAEHNKYRRNVNPTASNMEKMYWDDKIAKIAQRWTDSCPGGHDSNAARKVPGYGINIGQNWARGYGTWAAAIAGWHSEVSMYRYGQNPNNYLARGWKAVGHYTQVVRDKAARVGCGFKICGSRKLYICNYAFGNPMDFGRPYAAGPTCSKCRRSCSNKLCDCKGKICLNGGTLDLNACRCSCTGLYNGNSCQNLVCPSHDKSHCGTPQPYGFTYPDCKRYSNVPGDCPIMCGLCSSRGGSNNVNGNHGNNQKNCAPDASWCGGLPKQYCSYFGSSCPAKCGKC